MKSFPVIPKRRTYEKKTLIHATTFGGLVANDWPKVVL